MARIQQDFKHGWLLRAREGVYAVGEWPYVAYQRLDIDQPAGEQAKRGVERTAARANQRHFFDDERSERRTLLAVNRALHNDPPACAHHLRCEHKAAGATRAVDHHVRARFSGHVNGHLLVIDGPVLKDKRTVDVTRQLRATRP